MSKSASPTPALAPTATATKRGAKAESAASAKKHHVCPVCERGFSTTGHLARHARVHTGERNHKCPFPGCETKCSRQDNLQQHYRIHLSPGSRRKSGRSVLRSQSTPAPSPPAASPAASCSNENPRSIREDSPPLSPPPLEDSRLYFFNGGAVESPPNSPPPLVDAYLPQRVELYRSEVESGAGNAYPQTHRVLPHIDTSSSSKSRMGSPIEEYWSTSSASDGYGSASAYPSPTTYPSAAASTYPSPTTQYPTTPDLQYPGSLVNRHQHPHTFRHASHSPAAAGVPVARSLTARHSIANIGAHVQLQRAQPHHQHALELESARQRPVVQTQVHQPIPQTPHYPPLSAQQQQHSPQVYTVPSQQGHVPYAATESYQEMDMRVAHPDTPSPPPSSHHSPQTPFTPFQEPAAVYAPAQAVYPAGGSEHGGMQYNDAHAQGQDMHAVYEHAAYQSPLSPHESAYHGYAAPSHPQAAPYVAYDARGHASLAYSAVPAMQFHPAPEAYGKHHQQHGYADAPPKAYSPLLLAALPSLRRESATSENYAAAARRDSAMLPPASLSSLAGYAGRESEPRYGHEQAQGQPPSLQQERTARESYNVASYAPVPRMQAPYLHHPQPQPPVAPEYLAEYGHGWRVAEVQ